MENAYFFLYYKRAEDAFKSEPVSDWKNKQRTLVLSSRGVTQRHRHLMLDIFNFMPHAKKEVKTYNSF